MKQKDIALILIIVFISGFASFFISRLVIVPPDERQAEVEVVEPIASEFVEPSDKYFNEKSENLTETIEIGDSGNNRPFEADSN